MRLSHIFFHGFALRLGMTTPTTVLRRSPANGTLVEPSSRSDCKGVEPALRSGLFRFPYSTGRKNAKMSKELRSTALKHFFLPAALGSLQNDALLVWNSAFQKRAELSQDEL